MSTVIEDRQKKLAEIKDRGVDPYPAKLPQDWDPVNLAKVTKSFSELKDQSGLVLVGRIILMRKHGKSIFATLKDASGTFQIYFRADILGDDFGLVRLLDVGDFVAVSGKLFTTRTGEPTLEVAEVVLLSKSTRPLPEKWHGLADVEERYRRRYLDLLMNPEVADRFRKRSEIIQLIREYFEGKGYLEVETPILQPIYGGGLANPFKTHHRALDIPLYLRISNELYLKRLVVGGFEKIFEFSKDFRNEGIDQKHNPEFTVLEAMTAYEDYTYSMDLVEELYESVVKKLFGRGKVEYQGQEIDLSRPWRRMTMIESIEQEAGVAVSQWKNFDEAWEQVRLLGIPEEKMVGRNSVGSLIELVFEEKVEEKLVQPTIIYNYPVETSPLAKRRADDPRFVERFEHFILGMEAGNHYSELNDPQDLRQRFVEEKKKIQAGFAEAHQTDEDFLEAIEYGMPPVTGIGVGVERMIMLLTDAASIKEVIFFPTMKPIPRKKTTAQDRNAEEQEFDSSPDFRQNDLKKIEPGISREEAWSLVEENIKNKNSQKHMLAAEAVMRAMAKKLGADEEAWALAGLLHDYDMEREECLKDPARQGALAAEELAKIGVASEITAAIRAHNEKTGEPRDTLMKKVIYAVDPLTGLIVSSTLVRPDKKLAGLELKSLRKRFKERGFSRNVNREAIASIEEVGLSRDEFLEVALAAMKEIDDQLGL